MKVESEKRIMICENILYNWDDEKIHFFRILGGVPAGQKQCVCKIGTAEKGKWTDEQVKEVIKSGEFNKKIEEWLK